MQIGKFIFLMSATSACCLLVSCSRQPEAYDARKFLGLDAHVSEADKRAARLLSLGNNGALQSASDPYRMTISCVVALGWLSDRLRESHVANAEQLRALDAAIKLYRQRAIDAGRPPAELSRDVEQGPGEDADDTQQARLAISCLQQLT